VPGTDDCNFTVYHCLDEVLRTSGVPPGVKGLLFSVIDNLRADEPASGRARLAEQISLAIHRLEAALRRGDVDERSAALAEIAGHAEAWIRERVSQLGDTDDPSSQQMRRASDTLNEAGITMPRTSVIGDPFLNSQASVSPIDLRPSPARA
jgi:hypothetical protein